MLRQRSGQDLIREASHARPAAGAAANLISCRAVRQYAVCRSRRVLVKGRHYGMRNPERASSQGWIVDVNEGASRAVAGIIRGCHSPMATEDLEAVGDLDRCQILGQGPDSNSLNCVRLQVVTS
jgi:hypothetical protein